MDIKLKNKFLELWKKYFKDSELPITFYFSEGDSGVKKASPAKGWSCLVCELAKIRNGDSLCYTEEAFKC